MSRNLTLMNRKAQACTCLLLLAGVPANAAFAQSTTPPLQTPAQRTDQYYQDRQAPPVPTRTDNPLPTDTPANKSGVRSDARFELTAVQFNQSAFIDEGSLAAVAQPYIGKSVGAVELNAIVDGVNALYTQRNITTARAVLSRQPVVGGVVHVDMVEGHLGKLTIEGNKRTHEDFVRRRIRTQPGDLLDANVLRDDMVYINRTSNLTLAALMQAGTERGQTDVIVDVAEPKTYSFDAFVDNAGVDTSGNTRLGLAGHMDGLFGVSDRLDVNIAKSRGGTDGQLAYSAIVTPSDGRLGVSYSRSQIDIVTGAFRDLDITGHSSVMSLDWTQPFIATQRWLLEGTASLLKSKSDTSISGTAVSDTTTNGVSVGVSLNHRVEGREWTFVQQINHLNADQPISGSGSFLTATGSFDGVQRLGGAFALRLDAGWQFTSKDALPSSSLFQLGGVGSVRGYDRGIVAGTKGYYLDLEIHHPLGPTDAYVFADHGAVYQAFPKDRQITGAGLGVVWNYRKWLSFNVDAAHAFTKVIPDQDSWRADFRVAVHF